MTINLSKRPDFPVAIDSTMRAEFISCPRKFFYRHLHSMHRKGGASIDLHAGQCFAKALEIARRLYYTKVATSDAALQQALIAFVLAWGEFEEPADTKKTFVSMFAAVIDYFDEYPMEHDPFVPLIAKDGMPMIEFSFAIPLEGLLHPQTGEPIIYFGRTDMIGEMIQGSGLILVEDDKTTSALGARWASQWELRAQFTGYVWAARYHGIPAQGALVRGISILKESFGHVQAGPIYRSDWEIKRWEEQLHRDIKRMIHCWEEGYWDYNLDQACSQYSGCSFLQLCDVEQPEQWLGDYEVRVWDPLKSEDNNG